MATAVAATAVGLLVTGLWITAINFYLSWIRFPLLRTVRRTEAVRRISGIPLIGSAALWLSAVLLPAGSAADSGRSGSRIVRHERDSLVRRNTSLAFSSKKKKLITSQH
jgi:hypothetical protein